MDRLSRRTLAERAEEQLAAAIAVDFVEGFKRLCPESVPMAEHVAAAIQAVAALELHLLVVEGLVQAELLVLDVGQQGGTQYAAFQEAFGRGVWTPIGLALRWFSTTAARP